MPGADVVFCLGLEVLGFDGDGAVFFLKDDIGEGCREGEGKKSGEKEMEFHER